MKYSAGYKANAAVNVGLVGCGGRGTGAAENCMNSSPDAQLVAMADMFPERLKKSRKQLAAAGQAGYKVTDDKCFSGFDGIRKMLDAGVDSVILATPPGFRPMHTEMAVDAGKHVFMEKPGGVDPVGCRKLIAVGEKAREKKLSLVAGTQYRHQKSFQETIQRVHDGAIGDVLGGRIYYNTGTTWSQPRKEGMTDMEWQLRNWLYFSWLSGDQIIEQHVHTIDVMCWLMKAHPVKAVGLGGRQVRVEEEYGNVYDHFFVDYEFENGAHVLSMCRQMANCANLVGAFFVGSKGAVDPYQAEITGANPWKTPAPPSIKDAYIREHGVLIESIQKGLCVNEAAQLAESTMAGILGREAIYTGQVVTWDQVVKSDMNLMPETLALGPIATPPIPMPGRKKK
jgi:predicted dehydrogenase